jgi:hypothetical protein
MAMAQEEDKKIIDILAKILKTKRKEPLNFNKIRQLQQALDRLTNNTISGKLCSSCKKEMVSGAFPKWFCLRKNCDIYLKEQY